jgi:hypothetical protein
MERSLKSRHTPLTLFLTQKRKHSFRKKRHQKFKNQKDKWVCVSKGKITTQK